MASVNGNLSESTLKTPVIEIADLVSAKSSSEGALESFLDNKSDALNPVDEEEDDDDDIWSLYEDALDALEGQDMSQGGGSFNSRQPFTTAYRS